MKARYFLMAAVVWLIVGIAAKGQTKTTQMTRYRDFKPAVITLADGRLLKQPLANVFLKNSSLLYMSGEVAKEANMNTISKVEFEDRTYVNLNGHLAFLVDSVGKNQLYCMELFDVDSYERNLRNNVNFTSIDFGNDALGITTVDNNNEEDYKMPVVPVYYFFYNGELVRAHDRELGRKVPKEKKRQFKAIITLDSFSWLNPDSLLSLLKAIS